MKLAILTMLLISCGKNEVTHYNGRIIENFRGDAEDVEEEIQLSSENEIPNKVLDEIKYSLIKDDSTIPDKTTVLKVDDLTEKHIKPTPDEMKNIAAKFESSCSDADGTKEYYYYKKRIESLGGKSIFPYSNDFPNTVSGFQKFLKFTGIKHFSANEVSEGSNEILKTCQLESLLPPKNCWVRGAVLFLLAEEIRSSIGGYPLSVGSWFRSQCYNKELKKRNINVAAKSDHLLAKAVDLFYSGKSGKVNIRKKIQEYVCTKYWKNPLYTSMNFEDGTNPNLSIGIGNTSIHLGVDSPKGKRSWLYKSYPSSDMPLAECFGS